MSETAAKGTWRDQTQAIVAATPQGDLIVILTSKTEKSIARTKAQATAAGLSVQGDAPLVAKNELPKPTFAAPEAPAPAPETAPEATEEGPKDPRPDLPGRPPGAPARKRTPRAKKAEGETALPRRRGRKTGDPAQDIAAAK